MPKSQIMLVIDAQKDYGFSGLRLSENKLPTASQPLVFGLRKTTQIQDSSNCLCNSTRITFALHERNSNKPGQKYDCIK
jgi:hypothetical protein